jgi:hypothetical protein
LLDQAGHRCPVLDLTRLLIDVDLHVAEECTGGFGASSRKWIVERSEAASRTGMALHRGFAAQWALPMGGRERSI